jgi:hypothetical protein
MVTKFSMQTLQHAMKGWCEVGLRSRQLALKLVSLKKYLMLKLICEVNVI